MMIQIRSKDNHMTKGLFNRNQATAAPPKATFQKINTESYSKAFDADPILFWGKKNNYPQILDLEARKCNVLEAGLMVISDHMYGQGLFLYREKWENNERVIEEVYDAEIMSWIKESGYAKYYFHACKEYTRWGNIWPIFLLNDQKKIAKIRLYDSAFCRLEKPDPKTGEINKIYVSAQWGEPSFKLSSKEVPENMKVWVKTFTLLDEWDPAVKILTHQDKQYAMHIKHPSSGQHYGRVPWHAAYENRWTSISISVPEMKMRLFEYAMTLNFIAYIDNDYWRNVYGEEWDSWDSEIRKSKIAKKQKEIEDNLIGKDNAFKTLFASMKYDKNSGKDYKSIIIEVIDTKLKEGNYIPDAQVADGQIMFSLTVDPSLLGLSVPGGKNSAGSGSNIREASLALNARMKPHRDLIHSPFYVASEINKWNPEIKIGVRDYIINTLDQRAVTAKKDVTAV